MQQKSKFESNGSAEDRDHECKQRSQRRTSHSYPALLSPLARPGAFETAKLVSTLPCLARRGIVRGSRKLFCSCSQVAKRRASGRTGPFSASLPFPLVNPLASNSLPLPTPTPADGIGEGPDDLLLSGLFHGAGTPVPYVSFSGPRWSTVGCDRRVTRDSTAPCTTDVSQPKHIEK
jgi:hypothetical protein